VEIVSLRRDRQAVMLSLSELRRRLAELAAKAEEDSREAQTEASLLAAESEAQQAGFEEVRQLTRESPQISFIYSSSAGNGSCASMNDLSFILRSLRGWRARPKWRRPWPKRGQLRKKRKGKRGCHFFA